MSKTLLIDGDLLLYKFACGNEEVYDWGDGIISSSVDLKSAKEEIPKFYQKLLEATECDSGLLCFSCDKKENFRYQVLPTYKHNRQDREKPTLYYDLKQYLFDTFDTKVKPTLEADDIIGILATLHPERHVIASFDKDLKQIPGEHYDWVKEDYFTVTKEEADEWFYKQILIGDACDGYKGCPGIGKKKAGLIIEEAYRKWDLLFNDMDLSEYPLEKIRWDLIVREYVKKGLTEEDALQQARVARILRREDWDFKRQEVKLWTPK